ncbi:unnamed protein product [Soboliphyme baturini]|uniref:Uncharacterized protein n=1 Tax=Soboliphyme baturini TaxID=241478 RepID=A0A183IRI3_9BILA|nr:unnamed protein product [Soboliphyme baturini]
MSPKNLVLANKADDSSKPRRTDSHRLSTLEGERTELKLHSVERGGGDRLIEVSRGGSGVRRAEACLIPL